MMLLVDFQKKLLILGLILILGLSFGTQNYSLYMRAYYTQLPFFFVLELPPPPSLLLKIMSYNLKRTCSQCRHYNRVHLCSLLGYEQLRGSSYFSCTRNTSKEKAAKLLGKG